METTTIDYSEIQDEVRYGKFGRRLGASLLDFAIFMILTGIINYFNVTEWKSLGILVVISLVQLLYKPIMEAVWGATIGKMAADIKVVNLQYGKIDLGAALMRSILLIVPALVALYFSAEGYSDPDFLSAEGYMAANQALGKATPASMYIGIANGLITLVDLIVMLVDQRSQALHDKIAGTYVIRASKA